MSIPSEINTSVKVIENLLKSKDFEIERSMMPGMQTETGPVIIGAPGLIKKGLKKHIDKIPGSINISELQKRPSRNYPPA